MIIPHVVLCLAYNEKVWRIRIRDKSPILSCNGVSIPLLKLQVWLFHSAGVASGSG